MKQGLSLRVSQHLALTPQLQQSIRLLQLSTLEMAHEVEQMLDENPFLERDTETAEREEFGLAQADASPSLGDQVSEWASADGATAGSTVVVVTHPASAGSRNSTGFAPSLLPSSTGGSPLVNSKSALRDVSSLPAP